MLRSLLVEHVLVEDVVVKHMIIHIVWGKFFFRNYFDILRRMKRDLLIVHVLVKNVIFYFRGFVVRKFTRRILGNLGRGSEVVELYVAEVVEGYERGVGEVVPVRGEGIRVQIVVDGGWLSFVVVGACGWVEDE